MVSISLRDPRFSMQVDQVLFLKKLPEDVQKGRNLIYKINRVDHELLVKAIENYTQKTITVINDKEDNSLKNEKLRLITREFVMSILKNSEESELEQIQIARWILHKVNTGTRKAGFKLGENVDFSSLFRTFEKIKSKEFLRNRKKEIRSLRKEREKVRENHFSKETALQTEKLNVEKNEIIENKVSDDKLKGTDKKEVKKKTKSFLKRLKQTPFFIFLRSLIKKIRSKCL